MKNHHFVWGVIGSAWFITALAIIAMSILLYGAVQQSFRTGANDPQIQLAEDGARALENGISAASIAPIDNPIDIAKSLAPFVIVYDENGQVISSSGKLNDTVPVPPLGVLAYAAQHGEHRVTWQPQRGVRIATVVTRFNTGTVRGFVLAGRSLYEVEKRENALSFAVMTGAMATLLATMVIAALFAWRLDEKSK
jgi:hypothetical protein